MIRAPWRRYVRYAPELDEQPIGTVLEIVGSTVTAVRGDDGWLLYGTTRDGKPSRDVAGSLARNLPARIVRRGKAGWRRER